MHPDEKAVRAAHARWIDAVNAGDLAYLLEAMSDDVVFVGPGQAPFGREGFIAGFSGGHRDYRLVCRSELEAVSVEGALAHAVCRDTLELSPREGGEGMALAGHRLTLYRKASDGRWRLLRDAHTLAPVAR
jgi:uncharacterized protein (TIGR02246 family)